MKSELTTSKQRIGCTVRSATPAASRSIMLGMHTDGTPMTHSLNAPCCSTILIVGSVRYANSMLLRSLLASACILNPPEAVRFYLLTIHRSDFENLLVQPHLIQHFSPLQRESQYVLDKLAYNKGEKGNHEEKPITILAIDELDLYLSVLSERRRDDLSNLLNTAEQHRICLIASLKPKYFEKIPIEMVTGFHTKLIGWCIPNAWRKRSKILPEINTANLLPGVDFYANIMNENIKLHISNAYPCDTRQHEVVEYT